MEEVSFAALDRRLAESGYVHIGGMTTNRVYRSGDGREVVKLALAPEPAARGQSAPAFRGCWENSRFYAPQGLMPEVFAFGEDFAGTGFPFLCERYVPGANMGVAYLQDPSYWRDQLPKELMRLYRQIQATASADVSAIWRDKLNGMLCPPGCEAWFAQVQRLGGDLMRRHPRGWRLHGDLQFGNLLARADEPGALMLLDWEVSEVMPLAYDFAMLYAFLLDPVGQVEVPLRAAYARQAPLREIWERLWPRMNSELRIAPEEMRDFVVFRMGNAWLYQLAECREANRAEDLKRRLRRLFGGEYFVTLPIGG